MTFTQNQQVPARRPKFKVPKVSGMWLVGFLFVGLPLLLLIGYAISQVDWGHWFVELLRGLAAISG